VALEGPHRPWLLEALFSELRHAAKVKALSWSMLHIHLSNRFEVLAALCLKQMAAPALGGISGLFQPRQVIVPSLASAGAQTLNTALA